MLPFLDTEQIILSVTLAVHADLATRGTSGAALLSISLGMDVYYAALYVMIAVYAELASLCVEGVPFGAAILSTSLRKDVHHAILRVTLAVHIHLASLTAEGGPFTVILLGT